MSARVLTAAALLTAALAGPAPAAAGPASPMPSEPQPIPPGGSPAGVSHVGGTAWDGPPPGMNRYAGGAMPPGGPAVMPAMGGYPAMPYGPVADPGVPVSSGLPTDGLADSAVRGPRGWLGVEYMLFWAKHAPLSVPIATVGPAGTVAAFGSRTTQVFVGNSDFNYQDFSGVRVSGGIWLTGNETLGIEGNLFILPTKSSGTPLILGSDLLPVLARPFFDTSLNAQSSRVLSSPNTFAGGISVDATHLLAGAEIGPVWRAFDRGGWFTFDILSGFKFLDLEETLTINDFSTAQRNGVAVFEGRSFPNSTTYVNDRFSTQNHFYGGMIGGRLNLHVQAFNFGLAGKLGLGEMRSAVNVDGSTRLVGGGFPSPVITGGGFYAVAANSGRFTTKQFVVIPELYLNMSVQVTPRLILTAAYNYLYVNDVLRPGEQLSTRVNPTLVPTNANFGARFGGQTPTVPFTSSSYWAQGFNLGVAWGF